jgi:hypothetical protein
MVNKLKNHRKQFLPSVNFISILLWPFLYKTVLSSFSLVTIWLCNFLAKNISSKAASKMLMKLTTGASPV